jgi:hypothetical protein
MRDGVSSFIAAAYTLARLLTASATWRLISSKTTASIMLPLL